jgi:nicotinate phosphoribosyltransferase
LNCINFQTLIATKAARVCRAAAGEPVLEFGLRRAQGIDGSVAASRAAYVGGCAATSNVMAGKLFDIPVRGTHAHSWIMCFDDEMEAFDAYAEAMPNNCIFLVDTYDSLEGVRKAVRVGRGLRRSGHEMVGIRLDSGDLAALSIEARRILDEGGFPDAVIVASSDLDEHTISDLKERGAVIGVWGVGTRLATAYDQPALGGVYKLSAVRSPGKRWQYRLKLSEELGKGSDPGILQVRRFFADGKPVADAVYDVQNEPRGRCAVVDWADPSNVTVVVQNAVHEDLLQPVFRKGKQVYLAPGAAVARVRAMEQVSRFDDSFRRLNRPDRYTVGLEQSLYDLKKKLISKTRRQPTLERWAVSPDGEKDGA